MLDRRTFLQGTIGAACSAASLSATTSSADQPKPLVIDTHQHLWDLSKFKLPWLNDAPEVLRHTFHLAEYRQATRGLNVKAVYMEVFVDAAQLIAEAEHVIRLSRDAAGPTIGAVIGGRPESPQFAEYAGRFKSVKEVKGVRRVLHEAETPGGYCLGDEFVRSVRRLGEMGLSFDLCMRPSELADGLKLADLCPGTRFIVDHCGNADPKAFRTTKDDDAQPWHTVDEWKRGIDGLAKRPNVIGKISGIIARLPKGGEAGDLAPIVNHCLDAFGPDRVVFGSDWPVCLLGGTLATWVEMLRAIVSGRPAGQQRKLWSENAIRHYGLRLAVGD
jgi:predicted TIM-barrel fold metal-dependent hydrolase